MPAIIMELAPLDKEKKARLVSEVTESVSRTTGLPPQSIFIFIKEKQPGKYWSRRPIAGGQEIGNSGFSRSFCTSYKGKQE